jgi:threonine/homoserine/homoserine lactone efflux protein
VNLGLYAAFLAATAVLILVPGPVFTLVVTESARHGRRVGFATVLGTTIAGAVQLALVVLGLAALISAFSGLFAVVRWAGAAYLVYLGVRALWRAGRGHEPAPLTPEARAGAAFRRGLLVSLSNPKSLVFHSAFLPQFVDPALPAGPQLALLGASYVAVAFTLDSCWMLAGSSLGARLVTRRSRALLERLSGGVLIAGGVSLAVRNA